MITHTEMSMIPDLIKEIKTRVEKSERVLVITLTKRMAEELTEFLKEKDIKVMYIHFEVDTMERIKILADLRRGIYASPRNRLFFNRNQQGAINRKLDGRA